MQEKVCVHECDKSGEKGLKNLALMSNRGRDMHIRITCEIGYFGTFR